MGREVRRVPMDFDWPLDKPWEGFVNPHYKACPACGQGGESPEGKALSEWVMKLMWANNPVLRPVTSGLAGREPCSSHGHDCCDRWSAQQKILKAAGLPKDWGYCKACNGDAIDPVVREAYEAWEPTDPPKGDGWQLWETVSEGSPITPVRATPEELADWLAGNDDSSICRDMSRDDWLRFLRGTGWAPSMVITAGQVQSGTKAMADKEVTP